MSFLDSITEKKYLRSEYYVTEVSQFILLFF